MVPSASSQRSVFNGKRIKMKKYFLPVIMLAIFEAIAVTLWLTTDTIFYLFNFSYIGLSISLGLFLFVTALFLAHVGNIERIMFWAFIIGNALYYAAGIVLAFIFKDNRAFCKYVCPITVFLKPMSYFSLIRIKCDKSKCISCGKCERMCPMEVKITDNSRNRVNGTECILCMECKNICPKEALY